MINNIILLAFSIIINTSIFANDEDSCYSNDSLSSLDESSLFLPINDDSCLTDIDDVSFTTDVDCDEVLSQILSEENIDPNIEERIVDTSSNDDGIKNGDQGGILFYNDEHESYHHFIEKIWHGDPEDFRKAQVDYLNSLDVNTLEYAKNLYCSYFFLQLVGVDESGAPYDLFSNSNYVNYTKKTLAKNNEHAVDCYQYLINLKLYIKSYLSSVPFSKEELQESLNKINEDIKIKKADISKLKNMLPSEEAEDLLNTAKQELKEFDELPKKYTVMLGYYAALECLDKWKKDIRSLNSIVSLLKHVPDDL